MSLALRDVRFLSTFLLDDAGDWKLAVERYAQERRTYHQRLLRVERWLTRLLFATGASADALRARAMPRLHELGVDLVGLGPDSASDDQTERALFA